MESSEHKTEEPRSSSAIWDAGPQYDYVRFEKCNSYGIPMEARHETGGKGDDLNYLESTLSYPQVGLGSGDIWGHVNLSGASG